MACEADVDVLFVPGWNGSCRRHWQTLWQHQWGARRVEQRDWSNVDPEEWIQTLDDAVQRSKRPVVLVAHSLGVLTVAAWAEADPRATVAGAFLVAPPDPRRSGCDPISRFGGLGNVSLPFPAVVAASENDPYASANAVKQMARVWDCRIWSAGKAGHINVESGHGEWPEGKNRLHRFLDELRTGAIGVAASYGLHHSESEPQRDILS